MPTLKGNGGWYTRQWVTVTRSRWGRYTGLFGVDRVGGVYAWYGDGELLYIGSSECLDVRVQAYFQKEAVRETELGFVTPWGIFRELDLKVRRSRFLGEWLTLEFRLIRRLKPRGNIRSKNPPVRARARARQCAVHPFAESAT